MGDQLKINPTQEPQASKAEPKEFKLQNGQECFVAESKKTFCTDEKGRFKPINGPKL